MKKEERKAVSKTAIITSSIVLVVFAIAGTGILRLFGITILCESDACCLAALACSKVTPFLSMNARNSSVAEAWIWLLYSHVSSSIFLALSSHKTCTLVRPFMVMASKIEVKQQKCGSRLLQHQLVLTYL
jgi:hypothetical protein